jgi:hypothetical protein
MVVVPLPSGTAELLKDTRLELTKHKLCRHHLVVMFWLSTQLFLYQAVVVFLDAMLFFFPCFHPFFNSRWLEHFKAVAESVAPLPKIMATYDHSCP